MRPSSILVAVSAALLSQGNVVAALAIPAQQGDSIGKIGANPEVIAHHALGETAHDSAVHSAMAVRSAAEGWTHLVSVVKDISSVFGFVYFAEKSSQLVWLHVPTPYQVKIEETVWHKWCDAVDGYLTFIGKPSVDYKTCKEKTKAKAEAAKPGTTVTQAGVAAFAGAPTR
ncbi:hypothetical protein ANO11243_058360 [Dothideomycetidae sp. 11243]|nr:hypothetical protein ANO11243_058360 [fungal sp. No.11243]